MAHKLPSNPEFLLEYMRDLPDEGESDDDFDGYLDTDDGPVTDRERQRDEEQHGEEAVLTSTSSLDALPSLPEVPESPVTMSPSHSSTTSPSLSPMQVQLSDTSTSGPDGMQAPQLSDSSTSEPDGMQAPHSQVLQ